MIYNLIIISTWECIYLLIATTNTISAHSLFDYSTTTTSISNTTVDGCYNTTVDSQPLSRCQDTVSWQLCSKGGYPTGAVKAGVDTDGGPIYIGRAHYEGDLLPAKVVPNRGFACISYAGKEIILTEYEVLVTDYIAWEPSSKGNVPKQAIEIGYTADGERLYCGRTLYKGTVQPGKVQPSQGCLYVPFDGKELTFVEYEVLILI